MTKTAAGDIFGKMKNRIMVFSVVAAFSLAGCAGMAEHEKKVDELGRTVTALKASIDERDAKVEGLNNKLNLLQEKLETAKADIERLSHPVVPEGLKVVSLEEGTSGAVQPIAATAPAKAEAAPIKAAESEDERPKGPEELYNRGQDFFLNGNFEEARKVLSKFLKAYPDHSLSDNALYWVGESYYSEKDFAGALAKFREVADRYPGENKAPDALLKAAYSCMEMEDLDNGKEYLEKVVRKYPGTEAAGKARKALDRIIRR